MSKPKQPVIAICYDFDGTLTPKNMQEYDFFNHLGTKAKPFWTEVEESRKRDNADQILTYMMLMIEKAKAEVGSNRTTKNAFREYGSSVKLFPGVEEWFGVINAYGDERGVKIEHYVVSSGIKEMIEGTTIAANFKKIYACSFVYKGKEGPAKWPAVAVNYTTKTQFLFRVNKGVADDNDNVKVNQYLPEDQRPIPFSRIIYIGDGATDVPCMKLVKEKGGHSIAVYAQGRNDKRREAEELLKDGRINYISLASYEEDSKMKKLVCAIIDKIVAANQLSDAEAKLGIIGERVRKTRTKKESAVSQNDVTKTD
jgi:2-hydroxy-3-keto-5-methylthiopentenyl-1-phosphate phosphatase